MTRKRVSMCLAGVLGLTTLVGCGSGDKPVDNEAARSEAAAKPVDETPSVKAVPAVSTENTQAASANTAADSANGRPPLLIASAKGNVLPGTWPDRDVPAQMVSTDRQIDAPSGTTATSETGPSEPTDVNDQPTVVLPLRAGGSPLALAFQQMSQAFQGDRPERFSTAEQQLIAGGADSLPVLLKQLNKTNPVDRELASMLLLRILPETVLIDEKFSLEDRKLLAEKMQPALADDSPDVRGNIACTLSLFQDAGEETLKTLTELTTCDREHVRLMAVVSLGNLGSRAASAIPAVRKCLDDENADIAKAAEETLKLIAATPE